VRTALDSQDRTVNIRISRTVHPEQNNKNRPGGAKVLGTRMLELDRWDRKALAGQLEKTVGMVQAGQERKDRMART
jgi:hypothetical protein